MVQGQSPDDSKGPSTGDAHTGIQGDRYGVTAEDETKGISGISEK